MYSIVANSEYTFQEMKLADLRDRIISENNLSYLDIIRGYHDVTTLVELSYNPFVSTEEQKSQVLKIKAYIREVVAPKANEWFQNKYDEIVQTAKLPLIEAFKTSAITTMTLDEVIAVRNLGDDKPANRWGRSMGTYEWVKAYEAFERQIKQSLKEISKDDFKQYILDMVSKYIADNCTFPFFVGANQDNLPHRVNLNAVEEVSLTDKFVHVDVEEDKSSYDEYVFGTDIYIHYTEFDGKERTTCYGFSIPTDVWLRLTEEQATEMFNDAVTRAIGKIDKVPNILQFAQNLETQPITINVNTKTGKWELIDGYRRLLMTTSKELLEIKAPIRVFTDLDDCGFLAVLYAANMWKVNVKNISFHDRGYLFALKTRFGFEFPKWFYSNVQVDYRNNQFAVYQKDLTMLYLYDFDKTTIYKECVFTRVAKPLDFYGCLRNHNHLIQDLTFFYYEFPKLLEKSYGYDWNILDNVSKYIVQTIGTIRTLDNEPTQKDITAEAIEDILTKYAKEFKKKHLSTDTYVRNFLVGNDFYNKINEDLVSALC